MQIEPYRDPSSPPSPRHGGSHDFRSYSASYAQTKPGNANNRKLQKGKSLFGSKSWAGKPDPEIQRKKRVASYKMYGVEGKVKGTLRKSIRWFREKYSRAVYGWS